MRPLVAFLSVLVLLPFQGAEKGLRVYFEWTDAYFWGLPPVVRDDAALPVLALYEDGLLVYFTRKARGRASEARVVQLTPHEVDDFVRELVQVGFAELAPHADRSFRGTVVTDQRTSVIRVWHDGEQIEKRNYGEWSETPEALQRTREFLSAYDHPRAKRFRSHGATLTIRLRGTESEIPAEALRPMLERVPAALLPPCTDARSWRFGLLAEDLREFEAAVGHTAGVFHFVHESRVYSLRLEPWLPGESFPIESQVLVPDEGCDRDAGNAA